MTAEPPPEVFDPDRLEAVRATGLLDTPAEEPFDRLARLAARVLETPLAFVTIVDECRSFWKACIGVDATDPAERQNTVAESFCQYVIGSRGPIMVDDTRADPRTRDNPSVELMGVAAWAGYPVRSPDGHVLGTFCVVDTHPRHWTPDQAEILETLAAAASGEVALRMAIEAERSARRRADAVAAQLAESGEHFANLARTLQESLLPPHLPDVPGLEVAAGYLPARGDVEVGGDFYDIFQSSRSVWSVVMGDVSGKGVQAAKMTALARYTVRAAAMRTSVPRKVLSTLNKALNAQRDTDERFLTAVFASVRRRSDGVVIRLCSAGHTPSLLRRKDGSVETLGDEGTVLGVFERPELNDTATELRPGDALLLYTDGVTEARHGDELYGDERLRCLLAGLDGGGAAAIVAAVEEAVSAFSGAPPSDDTALLVLRVPDP